MARSQFTTRHKELAKFQKGIDPMDPANFKKVTKAQNAEDVRKTSGWSIGYVEAAGGLQSGKIESGEKSGKSVAEYKTDYGTQYRLTKGGVVQKVSQSGNLSMMASKVPESHFQWQARLMNKDAMVEGTARAATPMEVVEEKFRRRQ